MERLPPLDGQFDGFVKEALNVAGPNVCQDWLHDVWQTHGQDMDTAMSHLMECRLRRNIKVRPDSGRKSPGNASTGSRRGSASRSSSCAAPRNRTDKTRRNSSSPVNDEQEQPVAQAEKARLDSGGSANSRKSPGNASADSQRGSASRSSSCGALRNRTDNTRRNTTEVSTPPSVASPLNDEQEQPVAQADVSENIKVVARFRPFSERELDSDPERQAVEFGADGRSCAVEVEQVTGRAEIEFQFNRVFEPIASQDDLYEAVAPSIVESAINGINGAIIAYGQTGSGKTHTMMGPRGAKSLIDGEFDDPELGIIPRVLLSLQDHARRSDGAVQLLVSYIEIYQEKVKDLLGKLKGQKGGRGGESIREDVANGLHLNEVTSMQVETAREAMEIMQLGNKHRTKSDTKMNADSSRSHALFVISITNSTDPAHVKFSQLYLVDLAGSERADKTGVWGKQLDEAKLINKSLLALGQVIWNLSTGAGHVPYRDSKLTRVLQNALGGNVRTCLICTASPHPDNIAESVSSLRFGSRASRVRNEAKMNIALDANELKKLLDRSNEELEALKRENAELRQQVSADQYLPNQNAPTCPSPQPFDSPAFSPSSRTRVEEQHVTSEQAVVKASACQSRPAFEDPVGLASSSPQEIAEFVARRLFTRSLLPSLLCPITRAVMRDPVCATDGNSYERSAIERHMRQAGRMPAMSPMTGKFFPSKQLFPNNVLKSLIASQGCQLPPVEQPVSVFDRVSMYLLDFIFSFLNGKALARGQVACTDFFAVGAAPTLWADLLSVEFGRAHAPEDPRLCFGMCYMEQAQAQAQSEREKAAQRVSKGLHLLPPSGR